MSDQCKEKIFGEWGRSHQCTRKSVKDGYCKQHHPDSVAKRKEDSEKRFAEKRENSPYSQLKKANAIIANLEKQLAEAQQEKVCECKLEDDYWHFACGRVTESESDGADYIIPTGFCQGCGGKIEVKENEHA